MHTLKLEVISLKVSVPSIIRKSAETGRCGRLDGA